MSKHSDSAVVLVNASRFFNHSDWDRAISLLEASLELDPQNADIEGEACISCELGSKSGKSDERLHRAMTLRDELLNLIVLEKQSRGLAHLAGDSIPHRRL